MRSLNLTRLARASEGSFFKDKQIEQAHKLRKKLPASEVAAASKTRSASNPASAPTVDTLSSISAQSAYRRIVRQSPPERVAAGSSLAARVRDAPMSNASPQTSSTILDAGMMQALGSRKLNMYNEVRRPTEARPLPGSSRYADGAVLGMTSFSLATAMVSMVGLAGGLTLYFNPGILESLKQRTTQFGERVDATLGESLRSRTASMKENGVLSEERRERLGAFLAGSVGMKRSADRIKPEERDIDLVADVMAKK